ncbi:MAG: hypothetical protein A2469_04585 [Candidatus Magasanikbacteria bacterium RIFOXYC2_FULL_40_16]|uniref:Uncharacterized protein n=3 Tax=Candidatus Magasanikiibacteriota TaxID=1752731 RepID=A0A1F6NH94_9BACT|nr:MAG: hypothetical protein A2224_02420 [Candidatus Magasanikbacteria bacterium RIFOXYA2_FULL_40_20]OGH83174.1 MAG: hypothetical protein A2373_04510 [Candidatus Magasanikbacteria bacterium RIFOXYB1_FULL_40_15]OGH86662.1 MAG: hypothetical protein A2301_00630 [Candidatus Magasanikbacteria bacterium RIFOXYB2_FULL_40_13]OGH87865.1 MAG: hypothetical protein A2206_01860 [Candidatus Magasanikbacteria bacterium RIFOXYA1_FULL_40_8]OGH89446.1 MAG: hypothetical protein A2469_04585 [Candidatus Magasanikba
MDLLKKEEQNKKSNNEIVPWYLGRKFWGGLLSLSILKSIYIFSQLDGSILKKIFDYFNYLASGFYFILKSELHFNLSTNLIYKNIYMFLLYYVILILLLFLTFRRKKVNIIFPILIIAIAKISTDGLFNILFTMGY